MRRQWYRHGGGVGCVCVSERETERERNRLLGARHRQAVWHGRLWLSSAYEGRGGEWEQNMTNAHPQASSWCVCVVAFVTVMMATHNTPSPRPTPNMSQPAVISLLFEAATLDRQRSRYRLVSLCHTHTHTHSKPLLTTHSLSSPVKMEHTHTFGVFLPSAIIFVQNIHLKPTDLE